MTGGTKALALEHHCRQRGWEFCCFDYRGHGLSSGKFLDYVLSDWIEDCARILEDVVWKSTQIDRQEKPLILVGSSMGAWISIHLALRYNAKNNHDEQRTGTGRAIDGILGIAAAPDFLQDFFTSSSADQRANWRELGIAYFASRYGDEPYPIAWPLIQDAANHWQLLPSTKSPSTISNELILNATDAAMNGISVQCPVSLIHGKCDEDISWKKSKELSELLVSDSKGGGERRQENGCGVTLALIEDGNHRLSRPGDVKLILDTLDSLVFGE